MERVNAKRITTVLVAVIVAFTMTFCTQLMTNDVHALAKHKGACCYTGKVVGVYCSGKNKKSAHTLKIYRINNSGKKLACVFSKTCSMHKAASNYECYVNVSSLKLKPGKYKVECQGHSGKTFTIKSL